MRSEIYVSRAMSILYWIDIIHERKNRWPHNLEEAWPHFHPWRKAGIHQLSVEEQRKFIISELKLRMQNIAAAREGLSKEVFPTYWVTPEKILNEWEDFQKRHGSVCVKLRWDSTRDMRQELRKGGNEPFFLPCTFYQGFSPCPTEGDPRDRWIWAAATAHYIQMEGEYDNLYPPPGKRDTDSM